MPFTTLVISYSLNPSLEGEDRFTWQVVKNLDQKFNLILITRHQNRPAIERYLAQHAAADPVQIHFQYFDLPLCRQHPANSFFYACLWHWFVIGFIRRNRFRFDISHQLHLGYRCPASFLWRMNRPFLWGPVRLPHSGIPAGGFRRSDWLRKSLWSLFRRLNPFLGITAKKAAHIFAQDPEVIKFWDLPLEKVSLVQSDHPEENVKIIAQAYWHVYHQQALRHLQNQSNELPAI